jgi:hypothetical protein
LILKEISAHWLQLHDSDDKEFLSYPWSWRLLNITEQSLQILSDYKERYNEIQKIFLAPSISLTVKLNQLLGLEYEHNRYVTEEKSKQDQLQ